MKAEEERQAAIRKEAAVRTAREQLEAVIREKREMTEIREQLNADIRARALITQKRQQADKQQQAKISLEKAKQIYLQIKDQPKTTVTTSNKRQLASKQEVPRKQPNNAVNTNDDGANIPNPWESIYPIPKASNELEQVIREGNK
ncbi:MAG: hypothetical protein V7K18_18450 [Nostoc sp.]|uniref:hypothetical protein n=1 Tax=Nostoc sp. TaxID=1180 RepID=UPI002FFC7E70